MKNKVIPSGRYIMLSIDDKCQPVKNSLIKDVRTTFSSILYREIFHWELCAYDRVIFPWKQLAL